MNNQINCIFLGSFLYPHGFAATKRKQLFLEYILKQGAIVNVLITLNWAKGKEYNKEIKGKYNNIPYEILGNFVKPNLLFPFSFFILTIKAIIRISRLKRKDCKNIIVAFYINFDTIILLLVSKILGYKIVFDIVEDYNTLSSQGHGKQRFNVWRLNVLMKLFLKQLASGLSVISSHLFNFYKNKNYEIPIDLIPVSAGNILLGNNKKVKQDSFKLLYSGTYGAKDGLSTLIDAFCLFLKNNKNALLILTGSCPQNIILEMKNKIGNLSNVILTGRLSEIDYFEALQDADVLLMTRTNSRFANAGFPFKLGEYLASGNPVICTNISDVSFYLKNNESAIIIPPDDVNELYKAICWIHENKAKAMEIGEKGRDVCLLHFNPENNNKKFFQLLQSV
jgi:glycosyltransferase involved in cell wall biosynthesis